MNTTITAEKLIAETERRLRTDEAILNIKNHQDKELSSDRIIAGALFDLMGMLTTQDETVTLGGCHEAGIAVKMLERFAEKRGLNLDDADVSGWRAALAASPQLPVAEQPAGQAVAICSTIYEIANNLGEATSGFKHQADVDAINPYIEQLFDLYGSLSDPMPAPAAPHSPVAQMSGDDGFRAWASQNGYPMALDKDGNYLWDTTKSALKVWQAASHPSNAAGQDAQKPVAWLAEQWSPPNLAGEPNWITVATTSEPTGWVGFRNVRPCYAAPVPPVMQAPEGWKLLPLKLTTKMEDVLEFGRKQPAHNTYLNLLKVAPPALAAPCVPQVVQAPEGWKLVPIEPSAEMLLAYRAFIDRREYFKDLSIYKAIIDAAPQPIAASPSIVPTEQQWQDMTGYGQVKVGDFISFFIGEQHFDERVKEVLNPGTEREELIYNKKKNYYVISKNVLTGFGNVKQFRFCTTASNAGEAKQGEES